MTGGEENNAVEASTTGKWNQRLYMIHHTYIHIDVHTLSLKHTHALIAFAPEKKNVENDMLL